MFFRGCVYACVAVCNPHSVNPSKYKGNLNRKPLSSLSSIPCWQSTALGQPVHWKDLMQNSTFNCHFFIPANNECIYPYALIYASSKITLVETSGLFFHVKMYEILIG